MIRTERSELVCLVCECNECGHEDYGGTLDFAEFVNHLKRTGWKIRKVDDDWTHTCPDCVRQSKE